MPIKDHDFKPAKILDPIYAGWRGRKSRLGDSRAESNNKVNMRRELEDIRKERENRTRLAPCWDCCKWSQCGKTAKQCKIYRGNNAPVKE